MGTYRRGSEQMTYRWFFGLKTPQWLDRSTSRFARRLNLLRITRSEYTNDGA